MPRAPLFRKALRDLRWQLAGYSGGLGLLAVMYVLLYPAFEDLMASFELPSGFEAFIGVTDMASLRNYIQTEFYSVWMPLLLAVYAITNGTSQVAGDEQSGRLEMVLAQPVTRSRLFLERAAALFLGVPVILLGTAVGFAVSLPAIEHGGEDYLEIVVAPAGMAAFGLFMVSLALLLGGLTPRRGQAAGLLTLLTAAFYVLDVVRGLSTSLEWLQYGSPFYYADTKRLLALGAVPWHQAVLYVAALIMLVLAVRLFEAREIGTGRSPLALWRRRRSARAARAAS